MLFKFVRNMVLYAIAICLLPFSSFAADEHTWEQDKAFLEEISSKNLSEDKKCQTSWDILWSWSKRGNLEARATMFLYSFPVGAHAPVIVMPGAGDELARRRNSIILAVHSFGVSFKEKEYQKTYLDQSSLIYNAFLNDPIEGRYFLECLKTGAKEKCINYAKNRLVPSFDKYAAEIDALMAQGMKPECHLRGE